MPSLLVAIIADPQQSLWSAKLDWLLVLQIPSDAEVVMASMKMKRREQTAIQRPPSTYAQDVASITSLTGLHSPFLVVLAKGD